MLSKKDMAVETLAMSLYYEQSRPDAWEDADPALRKTFRTLVQYANYPEELYENGDSTLDG